MFGNLFQRSMTALAFCSTILALLTGCGSTNSRRATEQLLISDAVDRSVSAIDFSALSAKKVYFDTRYINNVKGSEFVNADYIVSSLRQQMFAAGCRLQDSFEDAEYVVEARVGTLGMDGHVVNYGIPQNNLVGTVTSLLPGSPGIPLIPEISFAKKETNSGAAKIGVFAYHRETKQPVWQSGVVQSHSLARDVWLLGAGPFQTGTIYKNTQFAGTELEIPFMGDDVDTPQGPPISYFAETRFPDPKPIAPVPVDDHVSLASLEEPVEQAEKDQEPAKKDADGGDTDPSTN